MGLGLAMISSMIWEVGGRFKMENSESGGGVMITIVVPGLK